MSHWRKTQSTGEPVQRGAGTMVDRIFCRFRSTVRILTTRACLTNLTLQSEPAGPPRDVSEPTGSNGRSSARRGPRGRNSPAIRLQLLETVLKIVFVADFL
jgi:hypothetical protein